MKHGKLDKRHTGHDKFKYYISFALAEADKFCEIREWCWQQWGASCEIDFYYRLNKAAGWAWVNDSFKMRLYLASDAEYQWYLLKWSNK